MGSASKTAVPPHLPRSTSPISPLLGQTSANRRRTRSLTLTGSSSTASNMILRLAVFSSRSSSTTTIATTEFDGLSHHSPTQSLQMNKATTPNSSSPRAKTEGLGTPVCGSNSNARMGADASGCLSHDPPPRPEMEFPRQRCMSKPSVWTRGELAKFRVRRRCAHSVKQILSALLLLIAFLPIRGDEVTTKDGWSASVNGLQARLIFAKGTIFSGNRFPEVYLDLHNVSDLGSLMEFEFSTGKSLRFELLTADGKPGPTPSGAAASGFVIGPFQLTLPNHGTPKFPVTWHGYFVKPNFGTMLCFENALWEIPRADQTAYFLSATLEIPKAPRDPGKIPGWHGTIKIPRVQAPTAK